jgi:hypothetical protein
MMRADDGARRWSYRASPPLGTSAPDYDTGSPPGRDAEKSLLGRIVYQQTRTSGATGLAMHSPG